MSDQAPPPPAPAASAVPPPPAPAPAAVPPPPAPAAVVPPPAAKAGKTKNPAITAPGASPVPVVNAPPPPVDENAPLNEDGLPAGQALTPEQVQAYILKQRNAEAAALAKRKE